MNAHSKTTLAEMLLSVREEREQIEARIVQLREREEILQRWVDEEAPQKELALARNRHQASNEEVRDFMFEALNAGGFSNAGLADLAAKRGLVDKDIDLRSIHSLMLSLMNSGLVERKGDTWVRSKK